MNLIPAKEAKAYVEAGKAEKDVKNLAEVTAAVNRAIQAAQLSVSVGEVTPFVQKHLESLGYNVKGYSDPRDHDTTYTIRWD